MIGELLLGIAVGLFALRFAMFDKASSWHIMLEASAGILFFIAMVFIVLPPAAAVLTGNTLIYTTGNVPTYTIVQNTTIAGEGPALNSWEPSLIYMSILVFEVMVVVFLIKDCLDVFFPRKGPPKAPDMPRW